MQRVQILSILRVNSPLPFNRNALMQRSTSPTLQCALLLIALLALLPQQIGARPLALPAFFDSVALTKTHGVVGDGRTDVTAALRAAINEGRTPQSTPDYYYSRPKTLYLPAGTYLVSDSISWMGCAITIQGQGVGETIIKLKDNCSGFGNPAVPRAVLATPAGNYSFRQNIHDLTIDVGSGNPGATALAWIANNNGCLRDVALRASEGSGAIGLDMNRYGAGPALVKNVHIEGFAIGISLDNREYGITIENLTLRNQRRMGIFNGGNLLHILTLRSTNTVPVIVTQNEWETKPWSMVTLLDAELSGGSADTVAIVNNDYLYVRNLRTQGYKAALHSRGQTIPGSDHSEFVSTQPLALFSPSLGGSLKLPIKPTPQAAPLDSSRWVKMPYKTSNAYYLDKTKLQQSINAGAPLIYTRLGGATLTDARIRVPATLKQFIGYGCVVNNDRDTSLTLVVDEPSPDPFIVERFGYGVRIEHRCSRTVVIKHGEYLYRAEPGAGPVFFEDVTMGPVQFVPGQKVWARQFNTEGPVVKIVNNGADVWILGIKTEKRNTVIDTRNGGRTELLGGLIYPLAGFTKEEDSIPAFMVDNGAFSAMCGYSAYAANGMYTIFVQERQGSETRNLLTSSLDGHALALYSSAFGSGAGLSRPRHDTKRSISPHASAQLVLHPSQHTSPEAPLLNLRGQQLGPHATPAPQCVIVPPAAATRSGSARH